LHQAHVVDDFPMLDGFTVFKTVNDNAGDGDRIERLTWCGDDATMRYFSFGLFR
jgi:hypothetical protein